MPVISFGLPLSSLIDAEPIMDSIPETRLPGSSPDEMFPVLTAEQQARGLAHGPRRTSAHGEIVVKLNEDLTKIFVLVSGQVHPRHVSDNPGHAGPICHPGIVIR